MVRSLDSALTAALNAKTRAPALTLTIEDHVPHYGLYQSPNTADAWNDTCIADDNSIIRVQVTRGGSGFVSNFQWQRITDPTQAAQWSTWNTFSGGAGNIYQDAGCAVANSAGVIRAFAQQGTGGNALWNWYSFDNGQTWSGPGVVVTPPGSALIKGIGSAGNNDVFFLFDVTGGVAIGCSLYSSSWSALLAWSLPPLAAGAGVAVVWNTPPALYTVLYSDSYSLATCTYNPGSNLWSAGTSIAAQTSTAIGRLALRIFLADGLYTLTCIEADSGALTGSVYSYPRLRQSLDLVHWSGGMILHDMTSNYGATFFKLPTPYSGNAGPRYWVNCQISCY